MSAPERPERAPVELVGPVEAGGGWYVVRHAATGRPVAWARRRTLLDAYLRDVRPPDVT